MNTESPAASLLQRADVLLMQFDLVSEEMREPILTELKDLLIEAEHLTAGSASWRLACVCGREGNGDLCRRWLERGVRYGSLPSENTIQKSPHLARIRGQKWYKRFLKKMEE